MRYLNAVNGLLLIILTSCIPQNLQAQSTEVIANVTVQSYGCFHQDTTTLKLIKSDTVINAQLTKGNLELGKIILSKKQLARFDLFIKQLKKIDDKGNCTTIDFYKVFYKGKSFESVDANCKWHGFDKLVKELFNL